ncbi:MAG TPA: glycerophosphodiester phosphodiesterase [Gemmatimonadales bacterium]|nr:glycerophosphodiester phosphodiesterase [Gemmatimonadales bacterium]
MPSTRRPRILAHRGASGHAWANSADAFRQAIELGADGVELDVHATADGEIVVHHDPLLLDLGMIATLSAATAREFRLPNGERLPLLSEALEILGDHEVWVEVKALPGRFDARLLAVLDAGPAPSRYAVHSFDQRIVRRLGRRRPELRRGLLVVDYPADAAATLRAADAGALWPEYPLIDRALVEAVHRAGGEVIGWTVDGRDECRRLAALGVDAICGNWPDRIAAALRV